MSLEDFRYRVSALNKSSAPYEKTEDPKMPTIITKNKKYLISIVVVLLLLIIIKPKFIQGKNDDGKVNNKISLSSLVRYWIIFSLVVCIAIYVYCNIICKKKNTASSSSCKRCSGS